MFEDMKRTRLLKKIMDICGGSFNNPSISDFVASDIILAPLTCGKKSIFKNNNYIICDASLLSLFYVYDALDEYLTTVEAEKLSSEIRKKVFRGINGFFNIQYSEIDLMYNNRLKAIGTNDDFCPIPEKFEKYTEEAVILFAHDYIHRKYVEYSPKSPVHLIGFQQQYQLAMETKLYFDAVIPMIINVLKSRLEN